MLPFLLYLAIELSLSYKTSEKVSIDFSTFFQKISTFLIFFQKNKRSSPVKRFTLYTIQSCRLVLQLLFPR
jgi:hypothetical protein